MGILLSILFRPCQRCRRHHYQLSTYLTPGQIQLIQCTWSILKLDLVTLGLTVFLHTIRAWNELPESAKNTKDLANFFETELDLKMLFPKMIRMNESNQLEWDVDREMLQKHAVTVMEGLGAAVENLHDSHLLNSVLIALGQTHEKRNIKPYMLKEIKAQQIQNEIIDLLGNAVLDKIPKMWPSLQHGLSTVLGKGYTKSVSRAWRRLYSYICLQMKIGMENPDLIVDIYDDLSES